MGDHRRVFAEFGAKGAIGGGAGIVGQFGALGMQFTVDGGGQGAGLDGADAHDADLTRHGRGDDLARDGRFSVAAHVAGAVEQVGDRLGHIRSRAHGRARP